MQVYLRKGGRERDKERKRKRKRRKSEESKKIGYSRGKEIDEEGKRMWIERRRCTAMTCIYTKGVDGWKEMT